MKERLKAALAGRQKRYNDNPELVPSAVLVPLYFDKGEWHILFTQRTSNMRSHKGQISFPGGGYESCDESLMETALRETWEEIGLAREDIEIIGELDDIATFTSYFVISPYVGVIPWPYEFELDTWEVDRLILVSITELLACGKVLVEPELVHGRPVTGYTYDYNGDIIWGASARILRQFLETYVQAMGGVEE